MAGTSATGYQAKGNPGGKFGSVLVDQRPVYETRRNVKLGGKAPKHRGNRYRSPNFLK
jgi:hypothetical protein